MTCQDSVIQKLKFKLIVVTDGQERPAATHRDRLKEDVVLEGEGLQSALVDRETRRRRVEVTNVRPQ